MVDAGESARISALEVRVATLEAEVRNLTSRAERAERKLDDYFDRVGKASERITRLSGSRNNSSATIVHYPPIAFVRTVAISSSL